ncbi:F-box only protein 33 [Oratosquilla oratoria]|uniref:F-box only protein 33 n=1 Tax=Oratosquilla oratoria TaxID=337810 RepID=UPI003F7758A4
MSTQPQWHWNFLPSVILIEILSYLPLSDRISACSTCKSWRPALFHPNFWRKLAFEFKSNEIGQVERSKFLASWGARKLRSCVLHFETISASCLSETDHVLLKLTRNPQVEELVLWPSHCHTFLRGQDRFYYYYQLRNNNNNNNKNTIASRCLPIRRSSYQFIESALESIEEVIINSRNLRTLILGCLQDLTDRIDVLLPILGQYQGSSISTLGAASVKYDPNSYALLDITPDHFTPLTNLQVLSLDYDYVNDRLLSVLTHNHPLRKFVIHVHGIDQTHRGTTDYMWHRFKQQHPQCSLTVNLIHSYDGVEQLSSGLLHPSMPLTHFRAFFCEWIDLAALREMSSWYAGTLCHLMLVDTLNHSGWGILTHARGEEEHDSPDPLVMMAWRCKNLEHLTLYGYSYSGCDVVAIARLRGAGLKELCIPEYCLEVGDSHELAEEEDIESITEDVSAGLGRNWRPQNLMELHQSVQSSSNTDTDEYMLPILLSDIKAV